MYRINRFLFGMLMSTTTMLAQGTVLDYARAEQMLPANTLGMVWNAHIDAGWETGRNRFCYVHTGREGKTFLLVNPEKGTKEKAFDTTPFLSALNAKRQKKYTAKNLPVKNMHPVAGNRFEFALGDSLYTYDPHSGVVSLAEKKGKEGERISPDGRWEAFGKTYNLWIRNRQNGEEKQLTFDGYKGNAYALPVPDPHDAFDAENPNLIPEADVCWSPDSRSIASYRMNDNGCGTMSLYQSCPSKGGRPLLYTYLYPRPGDSLVPLASLFCVDITTSVIHFIKANPLPMLYYGGAEIHWLKDSRHLYYTEQDRGWKKQRFRIADAQTGACRTLFEESASTVIDPWCQDLEFCKEEKELVWLSERSGWAQLYSYPLDSSAPAKALTSGSFVVRNMVACDDKRQRLYFLASGREQGAGLYEKQLYQTDYAGSHIIRLSKANADHSIQFSPDRNYYIDTYSRPDLPPVSELCAASDGQVVMKLETANADSLLATGWKHPLSFVVKARDGQTDIYGVLYRPANFDSTRKYPVIEKIYTGPHNFFAPKTFWAFQSDAQSVAELGFIVVQIDGMGTGKRSKAFHDVSYQNLTDGGLPDHISGLKQLAGRYAWMDLERVGVYGFSAGGYDAANAILSYPDFYKVAVASSGNHDQRADKADWNEVWLGYPAREQYDRQSNLNKVKNLKGHLLIVHGELDNNVNPVCSLQLVNALIKANKKFDFLLIPGMDHYLDQSLYYSRKRFDYFVKYLLGVEPPERG